MLIDSGRRLEIDKKFDVDQPKTQLSNYLFLRLVARRRTFTEVDFRYAIFDNCYMRDCRFDSCDFTGSRFVGTNLHGSKFSGCDQSEVNLSFFSRLAACRTRSSACDTLARSCARRVLCLLACVPLGLRPWLHRLRGGSLRFVRRLPSYYDGVRLLGSVHRRL